jgi:hypothetical protein
MGTLTTALVGLNVQTLAPAPLAGQDAESVTIINLDTANTVNLGGSNTNLAFPLGPLASATLTAPVYAAAATEALEVGIAPGGSSYSPGSLTITGPVTAEITGPVTVEGTVDIGGTTDVEIQNANIDVIGSGGTFPPGSLASLFQSVNTVTVGPNSTSILTPGGGVSVTEYSSIVLNVMNIANSSTSAGAAVCAIVKFNWIDSNFASIGSDVFSVLCSNGQSGAVWEVPVKGVAFTLAVENVGSVGTLTVSNQPSITINGSYRVIPNTRVMEASLSSAGLTITGTTVEVQGNPIYGIAAWIASIALSYPASAVTYVFPLPQWAGQVSGWYDITTTALARNMTIVDLTYAVQGGVVGGAAYTDGIIFSAPAAIDTAPVDMSFNLPPTQCALIITTSATLGNFACSLVGVAN